MQDHWQASYNTQINHKRGKTWKTRKNNQETAHAELLLTAATWATCYWGLRINPPRPTFLHKKMMCYFDELQDNFRIKQSTILVVLE